MAKDWRHLTNGGPNDKTMGIKDEHYTSPVYRTRANWEQLEGEGVFTLILVLDTEDREPREIVEDVVESARTIWNIGRHICVADPQGANGQCDLYLSFRLPSIPTVQEVEQLYRKIKGL